MPKGSFPLLLLLINRDQAKDLGRREINKRHIARKEESKLSLFADNMIFSIHDPTHSTKKLLVIVSKFSKVVD